jgi:hypothetical protein
LGRAAPSVDVAALAFVDLLVAEGRHVVNSGVARDSSLDVDETELLRGLPLSPFNVFQDALTFLLALLPIVFFCDRAVTQLR